MSLLLRVLHWIAQALLLIRAPRKLTLIRCLSSVAAAAVCSGCQRVCCRLPRSQNWVQGFVSGHLWAALLSRRRLICLLFDFHRCMTGQAVASQFHLCRLRAFPGLLVHCGVPDTDTACSWMGPLPACRALARCSGLQPPRGSRAVCRGFQNRTVCQ